MNADLAQRVVEIISKAAMSDKKRIEENVYVQKSDHSSQESDDPEASIEGIITTETAAEMSYEWTITTETTPEISDEGIFTTDTTPGVKAEEYVNEDASNERAAIEELFQQALSTLSPSSTEPPALLRAVSVSEVDIDNIAEKVRQKLEKYFISTTTGVGQLNDNSQKQNGFRPAQRLMHKNKQQQKTTPNNNNNDFYEDTSETTNNNNNNNDNLYGQESFINNNYKTVSYSHSNTKKTHKLGQESTNNNNNNAEVIKINNDGQNIKEYSSLREAPHGRNNKKRQNTYANNNNEKQQTYNNNEEEIYINNNRPDTYANNYNNGQHLYTTNNSGQNSVKKKLNVQETYLNNNNKQVTYANNNNNQQQEMNMNNNEGQQTITNTHKRKKKTGNNKHRSIIRSDAQPDSSNIQLNEQKVIRNYPGINQDSPINNPINQQSGIQVSSPRIHRIKYRPHQQADVALTEKSNENQNQKATIPANPEDMMVEVALGGANGNDFYADYKMPEKDENIFASEEKETTKKVQSEKGDSSPSAQKKSTTTFRVETENLNFNSNEQNLVTKKLKITGIQKKSTYSIFRPDFPEKMPVIAVPYNFSEPIPEKDRIEDNRTFKIPPARVNGKLSLI